MAVFGTVLGRNPLALIKNEKVLSLRLYLSLFSSLEYSEIT